LGLIKLIEGKALNDPDREAAVLESYRRRFDGDTRSLPFIEGWVKELIRHSIDVQRRPLIAYQGSQGSWSEESLMTRFPTAAGLGNASFEGAWSLCQQGRADAAWLPLRNSTIGPIPEVAAILHDAQALVEMEYPVVHALLVKADLEPNEVRRIWGHPYALAQCRQTLARDFPGAELVAVGDAQVALPRLEGDVESAVVASRRFADLFGLHVLSPSIVDDARNQTRFALLVPRAALGTP
jgi:chorismate mutase/prephenate dehydratase